MCPREKKKTNQSLSDLPITTLHAVSHLNIHSAISNGFAIHFFRDYHKGLQKESQRT